MPVQDPSPNMWSFLIELVKIIGTLLTPVIAAWIVVQNKKIHTLVNGNLHTEQKKVSKLRSQLEQNGITPED